MDTDDPSTPLLGNVPGNRYRRFAEKLCGLQSWRRRLPITIWLPQYSWEFLLKDIIAGITVGLTSIPQGIAYAMVAGLPPQVGLYSSIFPGIVYTFFGSCKDVTVGPTAILAALLAKYVAQSADFAYLAAFLSGCVIMLLGVLQLGFLLDFISKPVISGFTTAAALQISASQFKSLFRISGKSGDTFISAVVNFFKNIKTIHAWDTLLGVSTIVALLLLKRSRIPTGPAASALRVQLSGAWRYCVRARNALVVLAAATLAYLLQLYSISPFALTGKIDGGLPDFGLPPFSTTVGNKTLQFDDMLAVFGPEGLVMPLVAILESIAIAKAFAGTKPVDGTQEMLAIGLCNVLSSCARSMPATGSFTRTALNHASGVVTPLGSCVKACLVLLAVTLLAEAFYFIPRATLGGIIIVAMCSIIEFDIFRKLWKNAKAELLVFVITVVIGISLGLEYGILIGAGVDILRMMAKAARPTLDAYSLKLGDRQYICVPLPHHLPHASAAYVHVALRTHAHAHANAHANLRVDTQAALVLDARATHAIDVGVVETLVSTIAELETEGVSIQLWNFRPSLQSLFEDIRPELSGRFMSGPPMERIFGSETNS